MIKPTPPPKINYPRLLFVPYTFAAALVILVAVQLVGFGGLSFGDFTYETPGSPAWIVLITFSEICALPFVLRLHISPLARFCSALFALLAPIILFMNAVLMDIALQTMTSVDIGMTMAFALLGLGSFWILNGRQSLVLPRHT